ncbi:DNA-directed RNA polymerase subunit alpha [Synergistales bacterium]|nr:DNA-directed RNA polymerase subunit alpha [Synergistales bacterium]
MLGTLEIERPEIKVEESTRTPTYGRLVIEPLERGYGNTLGNALRRVLLSSIQGAAVTAIRIEGALHEFSTVSGVREDVIEILMNLKHVPVRSYAPRCTLHLELDGPKDVSAADLQQAPSEGGELKFVDPDAKICTLEEGAHVEMDIYIEQGMGYISSERPRPTWPLPIDALLADAVFAPVLRVNYAVEAARVGQRTDFERLVIDLWTNGVVTPEAAVHEAAQIIRTYFDYVVVSLDDNVGIDGGGTVVVKPEPGLDGRAGPIPPGVDPKQPVRNLELSIRSENCLLRGNIHTIGDLLQKSRDDLLKIRNLGKISLKEIGERLDALGLHLREKSQKTPKED